MSFTHGYREIKGLLLLKIPTRKNDFLFFQCFKDTLSGNMGFINNKLLTTKLSMSDNNDHGRVIYRDSILIKDNLGESVTACRHADGRDWWLLVQQLDSNCYYKILSDSSGANVAGKSCIGISARYTDTLGGDSGPGCFSPDGSKYAAIHYFTGVSIYDFDRCSGELSNPHNYPIPQLLDSAWYVNDISFSPNSKFLYASIGQYVLQFDTWRSNPMATPDTVGSYDGFQDPFGSGYNLAQLAPDGRIYIASGNSESNYSIIDSPDLPGGACHFMPYGLSLAAYHHGPPNNPNYRLGRQIGSPCDTLSGLMEVNTSQLYIRIYPNPALDFFIADYGLTDWSRHESLELYIRDIRGQLMYSSVLPKYSGIHKVNSESLAPGMYLVEITDGYGRMLCVRKVVKE